MSWLQAFSFGSAVSSSTELPVIYEFGLEFQYFVKNDLISLYSKILTDCIDRTQGIPEKYEHTLWDNCLESENRQGLITMLAEAMACEDELFLVYKENVLRKATSDEAEEIKADYEEKAESKVGVFISFKNYRRTRILKVYSGMEYAVLNSLNKSMNLSKAIQFKMSDLRESVGVVDSQVVINQAKAMATALGEGKDVLMDDEDSIVTASIEMESTKQAIMFLDAKRAFVLSLPLAYINGEQTTGIGTTGEADTKAVERGLRQYWISIVKPTLSALFGIKVTFKSQDFRMIDSALEALKTFDVTGEDILSINNKRTIVSALLGVENDLEGEPVEDSADDNNVQTNGFTQKAGTQGQAKAAGNSKADAE